MSAVKIEMPLEQEGTKSVVRAWLKRIGDRVEVNEPIVELETDKVAVEVGAPAAGVLTQILLDVDAEAPPGAVLGTVSTAFCADIPDARSARQNPGPNPQSENVQGSAQSGVREQRLSPLVRRLISKHDIAPNAVRASGRDGRITHADVIAYIETKAKRPTTTTPTRAMDAGKIPHDAMRRAIAAHMVSSVATAPHVTAVFEADFSAIMAHRKRHKSATEQIGAPLTYSAYFIAAAAAAMGAAPAVNSRWHDDYLEVFEDANIGIGVALGEKGLIVPVIARAQTLSLQGVAKRLNELTEKARANKLTPADVQGGTFTISNHGVSGSLLAAPIIINQPQAAILGVGKLEKRVVVREAAGGEAILVRPMAYVSLTIDHRVLDGHQTNAWLTRFVEILETWTEDRAPDGPL